MDIVHLYPLSLLQPDILLNICEFLLYDQDPKGLDALATLARSSILLNGKAVDLLWRWLPSLAPLIFTMPADLWKMEAVSGEFEVDRVLIFVRELKPSDFTRFLAYAPRVKTLGAGISPVHEKLKRYRVHPDIIRALDTFRPPSLLPNLQTLDWSYMQCRADDGLPCIRILFGRSLKTIKLVPMQTVSQDDLKSALAGLKKSCPQVEHLTLIFRHVPKDIGIIPDFFTDSISGLRHLRSFKCSMTTTPWQVLLHLATLPTLDTLNVDLRTSDDSEGCLDSLDQLPGRQFISLRSLTLVTRTLPMLIRFLEAVQSTRLANVRAAIEVATSGELVEEYFNSLAVHRCCNSLRTIKLEVYAGDIDGSVCVVTRNTFLLLMNLPNIRSLDIDIDCPCTIDDEDLSAMGIAWPNLTQLMLGVRRPWQINPHATFAGLISLIKHCPRLWRIGLVLDTSLQMARLNLDERPGGGASSSLVEEIDLGNSKADEPIQVAAVLSDLFPDLEYIGTVWPDEDDGTRQWENADFEMHRVWDTVTRLVKHFSTVRRQERSSTTSPSLP